ncbi:MAG: AAA family ATPase, partial [Spirochaetales bacterium]|nr:AAA family ATPase [Spirochaetales bacterium]
MEKKGLAIGVENFKAIIDGNSYYVDKTSFIKELLDKSSSGGVRLFLRPRRFGKTLALSTLRYFLDIE